MAAEQAQSQVDEILKELLRKGCRVKIVLLDPTAPKEVYSFLETYLACGQNTLHPRVCHAVDHFTVFRDSLNREERERFDLRVHSFPLTSSAFILDREEATSDMLVDVKWFGAGRNSSLILEFRRKKDKPELLKTIEASFLRVLKLSRQV
jgi:hypothetical protein